MMTCSGWCSSPATPVSPSQPVSRSRCGSSAVSRRRRSRMRCLNPRSDKRIFRAENDLARVSAALEGSDPTERTERLDAVLEVIYLIFNEGYAATSGIDWTRPELCDEALRLGRLPVGPRSHSTRADRYLGCRSTRRGRWAPTCFKPKSRRVTHEPAPRPERTGDRSRSGTTCWPRSPRHRSCSSTGPYQVGRSHGPPAGLALLDTIGDDPKVVATTSTAPFGPTCSTSLAAPKKPGPSSNAPRHSPPTKPNKTCSSNAPPGSPTRSENLSSTCRTRLAPSDVSVGLDCPADPGRLGYAASGA